MTLYIISAPPSMGKSYLSTYLAVRALKDKKTVYSNYPIIYYYPYTIKERLINLYRKLRKKPLMEKKVISTYAWKDSYIDKGLSDSIIFLDEAYKMVNCHDRLTENQHEFFATTGHNNIDIYVIAQNYARINIIIREMAIFLIVRKISNPFSLLSKTGRKQLTPLFFILETYLSEHDYQNKVRNPDAIYKKERFLFRLDIAGAYDTQYYRKNAREFMPRTWLELLHMDPSTL